MCSPQIHMDLRTQLRSIGRAARKTRRRTGGSGAVAAVAASGGGKGAPSLRRLQLRRVAGGAARKQRPEGIRQLRRSARAGGGGGADALHWAEREVVVPLHPSAPSLSAVLARHPKPCTLGKKRIMSRFRSRWRAQEAVDYLSKLHTHVSRTPMLMRAYLMLSFLTACVGLDATPDEF